MSNFVSIIISYLTSAATSSYSKMVKSLFHRYFSFSNKVFNSVAYIMNGLQHLTEWLRVNLMQWVQFCFWKTRKHGWLPAFSTIPTIPEAWFCIVNNTGDCYGNQLLLLMKNLGNVMHPMISPKCLNLLGDWCSHRFKISLWSVSYHWSSLFWFGKWSSLGCTRF